MQTSLHFNFDTIAMINHLKFILTYPKIGPDMYLTHWLLFFKPLRVWFQNKKIYKIGKGSEIRPFATIIGTDCIEIGENVIIPPGTMICATPGDYENNIVIENDVLLGPNVSIYSQTHRYMNNKLPIKKQGSIKKKTIIKSGAWLGVNSVILPGVTVGINSVVGAGSIVTKNVIDFTVVAGVPAKAIKNSKGTRDAHDAI